MNVALKPPIVIKESVVNQTIIARVVPYTTMLLPVLRLPSSTRICVAFEQSSVAQSYTLTLSYPLCVSKVVNVIWTTWDSLLAMKIHLQSALLG